MKPLGDWNHYIITCIGKKIEVRLNGKKVNVIDLECFTSQRNPDPSVRVLRISASEPPRLHTASVRQGPVPPSRFLQKPRNTDSELTL